MSNFLHRWISRPARHGLATLAFIALCIAAAVLSHPSLTGTVASALTASRDTATDVAADWPRTAVRLWFILPRVALP